MNTPRTLILLAALLAQPFHTRALPDLPDPRKPPAPSYSAECEWIAVPASAVLELVPELSDETTAAAAWGKVLAMLARGEATVSDSLFATGGEQMIAQSTLDVPYVTNVTPPAVADSHPFRRLVGPREDRRWIPTDVDRRMTGPQMELEVSRTADSRMLLCNYVLDRVQLKEFLPVEFGRLPGGSPLVVDQPRFTMTREMSGAYLECGRPKLVGVQRLPGKEAKFELVVLTVHGPTLPARTAPPSPWGVRLALQIVAVPVAVGRHLVPLFHRPESFAAGEARVQSLLKSREAELLAYPVAHGLSGGKLESAASEEVRSVCERDLGIGALPPPARKIEPPWFASGYTVFGFPLTFDSRAIGLTLRAEPHAEPAGVGLTLEINNVQLESLAPAIGADSPNPDTPRTMEPVFSSMKFPSILSLPRDSRRLLGQFLVQKPQPRLVLFLLHSTALPPPHTP